MQLTHWDNPLHRIEVWMGKYFRAAALWEVGGYLLVPHHIGNKLCSTLVEETAMLEMFQKTKEGREEQIPLPAEQPAAAVEGTCPATSDTSYEAEAQGDARFMQTLDEMYHSIGHVPCDDDILKEDDQNETNEDDLTLPAGYLPDSNTRGMTRNSNEEEGTYYEPRKMLRRDALAHPFVHVVHTNGIHHIALVCCGCRGEETTHADLMVAHLVPTSFVRYRTLFTHQVLDDFRLSNLECKASAYQYFQKLRRHTSAMAPESVPDLYHELRHLSWQWQWMKKLKWAGFGHDPREHMDVAAGSLAIFCPACPQPGINLPENWEHDPQRWVNQRSFVADGNFKADHVRQKNAALDVWLSEGGGMMSKRKDYEQFLEKAVERVTVSKLPRGRGSCSAHPNCTESSMSQSLPCHRNGNAAI